MASNPAAGMNVNSAAVAWEIDDLDGATSFAEAIQVVQDMKMSGLLTTPIVVNKEVGTLRIRDLPLRDVNQQGYTLLNFCDIIPDQEPVDKAAVEQICGIGDYKSLPPPLKLRVEPRMPYTMQVFILPAEGNKVHILKHVIFRPKGIHVSEVHQMAYGLAQKIDYGRHFRDGSRAFQWMLEQLGGFQVRYFSLTPKHAPKGNPDRNRRRAGYAFIRDHGPRSNKSNQFVEWTDEQVNDPRSPIFEWKPAEVKESLTNYAKGTVGAKTIEQWPLTLRLLYPEVLNAVVAPMIGTHNIHSILWVGKSRAGKSTLSKSLAMAVSALHLEAAGLSDEKPACLTAKRLDFFRLEPGSKFKPAIADDAPTVKWDTDDFKAFHDPAEEDALLWARWGGSSFEQNQFRQTCVNPFNKEAEPAGDEPFITYEAFLEMMMPVWPKNSMDTDIEGYLNRCHVVILSDKWITYRLARAGMGRVTRMKWPRPSKPDLFTPAAVEIAKACKQDRAYVPDNYKEELEWDVSFIKECAQGRTPQRSYTILAQSQSSGAPQAAICLGQAMMLARTCSP